MKLCAVQLASRKGDFEANLARHQHCIEQAAAQGAGLVVFPELSLTGYEPTLARQLALPVNTPRLAPLQALCDRLGISVAAGLPLPSANGVLIGMPILRPGQAPLAYAKQRLHADELPFFAPGKQPFVFGGGEHQIAPAICYESMFIEHALHARELGADLYLVSVAKTAKGVREGYEHYPQVARNLGMPVLLANCVGPADTFIGAGGSAAWDRQGNLLATLDERQEGLVILDTAAQTASCKVLDLGRV
ncbi:carbon-nitrogen hydrolase family protein [Pantoea sp. Ap-967]|uniref:carbon-nitrogen hydrolase family protein n=1 Tax=Pantoea sp. Ap-967 TaxID=2608362 RepID=UPI00141F9017|nr:carbon-nitrogen hydrolase family protein [Pantoea sp. Ap-967]NIE74821.1 carbon-nitrogen hydrolase family protein [Pantoea sp. Ap-967]